MVDTLMSLLYLGAPGKEGTTYRFTPIRDGSFSQGGTPPPRATPLLQGGGADCVSGAALGVSDPVGVVETYVFMSERVDQ